MPFRPTPLLALAAVLALGCAREGPTPPDAAALLDRAAERVPITRFTAAPHPLTHYSGVHEPARLVVRDDALWRATWAAIWSNQRPEPALPAVDLAREMVVVAALGARASGGYGILVDSASRRGETLVVHVRTIGPGPTCYVTAALTQPVDAVRLARHDGPVEFDERTDVRSCD